MGASKLFVLKVYVLQAEKIGKHKDLSEFDKGSVVIPWKLG